jgi:7-carboxy-7-deazaguanine synthase
VCRFCDTDFVGTDGTGGGRFAGAAALADAVLAAWPAGVESHRFVVCTGGEPLLQLDAALLDALHARRFRVAVETNGTQPVPQGVDWVCVSPKAGAPLAVRRGNELKLVFPQPGAEPEGFAGLDFAHFFLQPMDGQERVGRAARRARSAHRLHRRFRRARTGLRRAARRPRSPPAQRARRAEKPSLESLCTWIWRRLAPPFPSLARVTVRRDSAGQSCSYTG